MGQGEREGAGTERERETLMHTETCLIYVIIPGSAKAPHARRQTSCAVCTVELPTGACVTAHVCGRVRA